MKLHRCSSDLLWVVPLAASIWLAPSVTLAQDSQTAAETLFLQGRELMERGQIEEACQKLADSQRIEPAVGTLLNLALCYKKAGKTASAWSTYKAAAAAARDEGQTARESVARQEAEALEGALSYATVIVSDEARVAGLELQLDGQGLLESLWNTGVPLNPGNHHLVASAAGHESREIPFEVDGPRTKVVVPRLLPVNPPETAAATPPAAAPEPSPATDPAQPAPSTSPPPAAVEQNDWTGTRISAAVVGSLGAVALATGAVFAWSAKDKYDNANCDSNNACSGDGLEDRHTAEDRALVSTYTVGVGLVAVASAAVLWFWPQESSEREVVTSGLNVFANAGSEGYGLGVSGSF